MILKLIYGQLESFYMVSLKDKIFKKTLIVHVYRGYFWICTVHLKFSWRIRTKNSRRFSNTSNFSKQIQNDQIFQSLFYQIPTHIMLSETCKDLLSRLLQRNPEDRISFYQFFNHPFVDLEHMPSNQCISKAVLSIYSFNKVVF